MRRVILDTDILSDFLKGHDSNVARNAAAYFDSFGVFTFTSVTVYEIVYGLMAKGASAQLSKVMTWLLRNERVTPTEADYVAAARIRAEARSMGANLELPDCLIATVAVNLECPVVTANALHFSAIQKTPTGAKLTLENWRAT